MANRRVRIYKGEHKNANIIGFSASAASIDEPIEAFLDEHGYTYERLPYECDDKAQAERRQRLLHSIGSVSFAHLQMEPPLQDRDIPALVDWCKTNIDTYHNSGYLVDNREIPPYSEKSPKSDGAYLAEWY